jgi:hypothetical protein
MQFQTVVINATVLGRSIDFSRGVLDVAPCRTLRGGERSHERMTSSQGVARVWEKSCGRSCECRSAILRTEAESANQVVRS